jgi:hypothetical protein
LYLGDSNPLPAPAPTHSPEVEVSEEGQQAFAGNQPLHQKWGYFGDFCLVAETPRASFGSKPSSNPAGNDTSQCRAARRTRLDGTSRGPTQGWPVPSSILSVFRLERSLAAKSHRAANTGAEIVAWLGEIAVPRPTDS